MMNRRLAAGMVIVTLGAGPAEAFDQPVFPLNDTQLKALEEYQTAKGIKAFAAGPEGQFSAQSGFASASIAVREVLKACDKDVAQKAKRCLLLDLDGDPVPVALQYAQMLRIDEGAALEPIPLRDMTLSIDAWRAYQGFGEKGEHKAFALSLKGVWARSWDAATIEEAEKEALEACNRNAPSGSAPCFIIARDRTLIPGEELEAKPDLSVSGPKSQ
jgi:hypothetical protein